MPRREISFAQEIIASKNALSIMSNVLLEASTGTLTIKATDIKVSFETSIPVETTEPGSATVFCDKLMGILASIPDGDLLFEQDDTKITVRPTFKKVRFQLKTISSDKYPEIPSAADTVFFSIPSKDFKEMVNQTIFAVSDDETRYFMNGVFMEKKDEGLAFVATDGWRLSFIKKSFETAIPDFRPAIVPPKVLCSSRREFRRGADDLAVTDKCLFVRFDRIVFRPFSSRDSFQITRRSLKAKEQPYRQENRTSDALRASLFLSSKSHEELSSGLLGSWSFRRRATGRRGRIYPASTKART